MLAIKGMRFHEWFQNNHELRTHATANEELFSATTILLLLLLLLEKQQPKLTESDYFPFFDQKRRRPPNKSKKNSDQGTEFVESHHRGRAAQTKHNEKYLYHSKRL